MERMISRGVRHSAIRVGLVTAAVLLVPLVAMQFTDEVSWTLFDFALAAALLSGSGALLELAVSRRSGVAHRAAAAAVGALSIAFGMADDAPGLVLFGLLLIAAVALTLRSARRTA